MPLQLSQRLFGAATGGRGPGSDSVLQPAAGRGVYNKNKAQEEDTHKKNRAKDITFFKLNERGEMIALPRNASDVEIMAADAATLCISNQKHGHA